MQSVNSGSISTVALPAGFNNSSTARIRFYNHAGAITGSGNRDKISIDNVTVTSTALTAAPSVTSSAATGITTTEATLNGDVTADGASAITERGFVYKTSSGVTITDNKTTVSGTTGAYTLNLTALAENQQYFFKAYAINAVGTTLSSPELSFTTEAAAGIPKIVVTLPGETSPNAGGAAPQTAGTPFNITLTTTTDGITTDTGYSGSKNITFSGPAGAPSYPATVSFSGGLGLANITLTNAQSTTITATDGTIAGVTSSSLLVNPGAIDQYVVTASSPQSAGVAFNVSVTARDASGNTVTTDNSTLVTMGSGSGNVSFDVNPKILSSGTFTVSATDSTAESTTITATDANSKAGVTGNIVVTALPKYRSKTTGNWNAAGTWEVSTDNGSTWGDAVSTPTSTESTITIGNGHTVTVSAAVAADEVVIANGGNLTLGALLTIGNGLGEDITVQNGGLLVISSAPTFNAGATASINWGGVLRVSITGYTGAGTGMNAASYVYANGAIVEYTPTTAPSSANVIYFPNVDAATIPVLKFTALTSGPGASTPTTINGVTEVGPGVSFSWTGTGVKTFRNGIRGPGSMSQAGAGPFVISGANAELGGGTLTLGANGLLITNGSVVTLSSDKTLAGVGILTNAGTLDLKTKTLTVSTAPVLSGTNLTEIDRNAGSPLSGKIVLSSGTFTNGGALTITNVGAALLGGEVFDLFDASAFAGSFSATNLPSLSNGLNWYLGNLSVDGTIRVNRAPVAGTNTITRNGGNGGTKVLITALLADDTDADTDTLSFVSVASTSVQGANVTNSGGYIVYSPGTPISIDDSFTYTISDGFGGIATGTVLVNVSSNIQTRTLSLTATNDLFAGSFFGILNTAYTVQYSSNLEDWLLLTNVTTSTNGIGLFSDPGPFTPERYYRIVYP